MPVATALMSSQSMEWRTPRAFFAGLHKRFKFTLDAAANDANALLPRYFTAARNGLAQDWAAERVFCNPPYGRGIGAWAAKCALSRTFVALLVPARTDTAYWHEHIFPYTACVYFVSGRLAFEPVTSVAPFPSAVAVFDPQAPVQGVYGRMSREGQVL